MKTGLRRKYRKIKFKIKEYLILKNFLSKKADLSLQNNLTNLLPETPIKRLRILGNAKSLEDVNFNLDNYDYMVVNYFFKSPLFVKLKPSYYVITDSAFYQNGNEHYLALLDLINLIDWKVYFFIPRDYSTEHIDNIFYNNKHIILVYYNNALYPGNSVENMNYCVDNNLGKPPLGDNVLGGAIYISIMIGYKIIELHGVSHDWLSNIFVNNNNKVCLFDHHFYDNDKNGNTFIICKYEDGTDITIPQKLEECMRIFKGYWHLRSIADRHDARILNFTNNSWIDAFERAHNV